VTINGAGSPLTHSILDADTITLNYDQDVFSLAFTALNYRVYGNVRYRYMLDGFDKRWRDATTDNRATYTHMDAGTYVFKVQASTQAGVWNSNEKQLKIIVRPAPWRTWWAYTLYAALLLSIAGWYLHLQRQKIRDTNKLNARLLELDRIKDEFMANTSHELRTPVNGIIGLTQALREDETSKLSTTGLEKIEIIQACGRRLARLVNDILDFSSIKKQQSTLNCTCVDVTAVIKEAIAECQINLANTHIQVENNLPSSVPMLFADACKVATIFYNVIANAYKFTEKGLIRIDTVPTDKGLCIEIADTGVGIEADHLASIFESFEQVASSGVRQKNGTGLGLAVCKHLVELHGGTIAVRSTRGVGSVFAITLPLASAEQVAEYQRNLESASETKKSEQAPLKPTVVPTEQKLLPTFYPKNYSAESAKDSLIIMVVDDEPVNRMVLRHMLTKRNHVVLEAANGQEATDAIAKNCHCDLVLMDIMMPVMSGIEACQAIRKQFSMEALPIIFVTAKTQQQDRDQCLLAGGNAFLTKPVVAEELFTSLSDVFARKIA
jgi:signal transduction histidine kinase/ActR/RegA family two-component response regulator